VEVREEVGAEQVRVMMQLAEERREIAAGEIVV